MKSSSVWLAILMCCAPAPFALAAGKARHVVVLVWDGMRPDFVTESNTPTLFQLEREGVRFANHHPVYLSETEPNGAAIATGAYPSHNGILGNKVFWPAVNPLQPVHPEESDTARKSDAATHGHHVLVPTVAEILHQKGISTMVAGAKPIALLHDRAERPADSTSFTLFAGHTLPAELLESITNRYGPFPSTNGIVTRNDWTTQALVDPLWAKGVPAFSVLWMNEPDAAQHEFGPGSAPALAAIKNADNNLARILQALEVKGVRKETDILMVSDHGFSTILSVVDVAESLSSAGFNAVREFKTPPAKGDILVVGNGGSTFLYVTGHDKKVINDAVKFLQTRSYAGVIFSSQPVEGAFTLAQAHQDSPTAPDVILSFRWNASSNDAGTPGMITMDTSSYKPGQGMHGSLSPFDMHNTFIAAGPDFRAGVVDPLPTGNVDIAPTVLWILGVKQPKTMDGRVVLEAMTGPKAQIKSFEPGHIEATRDLGNAVWHQYLNFTEVNGVAYYDEGDGFQTAK